MKKVLMVISKLIKTLELPRSIDSFSKHQTYRPIEVHFIDEKAKVLPLLKKKYLRYYSEANFFMFGISF